MSKKRYTAEEPAKLLAYDGNPEEDDLDSSSKGSLSTVKTSPSTTNRRTILSSTETTLAKVTSSTTVTTTNNRSTTFIGKATLTKASIRT